MLLPLKIALYGAFFVFEGKRLRDFCGVLPKWTAYRLGDKGLTYALPNKGLFYVFQKIKLAKKDLLALH